MADFVLTIATPERQMVDERASEATVPALNGYLGILPGHAPLLSELGSGVLTWTSSGQTRALAVMGGFLEILGDRVRVLTDSAKKREEIDPAQAQERLRSAQQALAKAPSDTSAPRDYDLLLDDVRRAQAEVDIAAR